MQRDAIEALAGEIHAAIGYSHICGRMDRYGVEHWSDRDRIEYNWAHAVTKAFIFGRGLELDSGEFGFLWSAIHDCDLELYEKIKVEYEGPEYDNEDDDDDE